MCSPAQKKSDLWDLWGEKRRKSYHFVLAQVTLGFSAVQREKEEGRGASEGKIYHGWTGVAEAEVERLGLPGGLWQRCELAAARSEGGGTRRQTWRHGIHVT